MTVRRTTQAAIEPDHLVVAAASLASGVDWIESGLGVRARPGGCHAAMGTHNALVSLGRRVYLEVIAIDPESAAPARPRWFDLDDPALRARLAEGPALIHWVARTQRIDADAARLPELGPPMPMQRGEYSWRITVPGDGHRPGAGLVPTLIEWSDPARHPADSLPASGLRLVALAGEHPEPAPIRDALAALGLADALKVSYGRTPRLAAMFATPRGTMTL
ncbi:MAG TPA: VOC family protein [Casimicrobiaceae bacterium]|nr:VOC family protein [Casimicrobiaceae bacterium]